MKIETSAAVLAAAALVQGPMAVAATDAAQWPSLRDFIQQQWKLPGFQPGRDTMASTIPLRVSTYSSPPFIHRAQVEALGAKATELAKFCHSQGGEWAYLGLQAIDGTSRGSPMQPNAAVADAVARAPATEAGMRGVVALGEQAVKEDATKELLRARIQQPDELVKGALEHATRMKWIGSFECRGPSTGWTAAIYFSKWANRGERGLSYKDITLQLKFTERP